MVEWQRRQQSIRTWRVTRASLCWRQPLEKERSDLEQEATRLRAERDKCEAKITEIKSLMLEQQQ